MIQDETGHKRGGIAIAVRCGLEAEPRAVANRSRLFLIVMTAMALTGGHRAEAEAGGWLSVSS
ncbi:MAG: hypothetical protein AAF773_09350 [Cyanobacteria bacterium P01_D01_bin.115]